jgi:CRP/FNR family transcriptional regulator, cyclic AMP receptor protein
MSTEPADLSAVPESSEARYRLRDMVPPHVGQALHAAAHRRTYPDGGIIYSQGEVGTEMYHILSGKVRLCFLHSDGRELVFITFEPGDSFGYSTLIDGAPLPHTAEACGEVEVEVVGAAAFSAIRAHHRELDEAMLHLLCMHMRSLSAYVAEAALSDLSHRLARRLLEVARPDAESNPAIRLSQGELALMFGVSRQTINKLLKQFEDERLVRLSYGNVVLQDLDGLRQRAATD